MKDTELRALVFDAVRDAISQGKNYQGEDQSKIYLSCKEAASFLGKTPNSIRQLVSKDQIQYIKKGALLYFRKDDLITYLEGKDSPNDDCIIKMRGVKK
jgi:hypothetical protein